MLVELASSLSLPLLTALVITDSSSVSNHSSFLSKTGSTRRHSPHLPDARDLASSSVPGSSARASSASTHGMESSATDARSL